MKSSARSALLLGALAAAGLLSGCGETDAKSSAKNSLEAAGATVDTNGAGDVVKVVARGEKITDAELKSMGVLGELTVLELHGPSATDAGLKQLGGATKLNKLFIHDVNGSDWSFLESLTNLEHLSLQGSKFDDAALAHVAKLKNLKSLNLAATSVTGAALSQLQDLKQLDRLYLQRTAVDDAGLKNLGGHETLTWLNLNNTKITDNGLEVLGNFPALQILFLNENDITDEGLAVLRTLILEKLKNLTGLMLAGTKVTDDGLVHLEGLTQLEQVQLVNSQISRAGLEDLWKKLPNCLIDGPGA